MSNYTENFDGRWNRALMDLHYQEARWRYFAVKNPPKDRVHQWYYEPGSKSQSMNKDLGGITYESVQKEIQNLADDLINFYAGNDSSFETSKQMLFNFLQKRRDSAYNDEFKLFWEINRNKKTGKIRYNGSYKVLCDNAATYAKTHMKKQKKISDSIDYWTSIYYNRLGQSKQVTPKDAFAFIIASKEFYQHLILKTGQIKTQFKSFFSQKDALRSNEKFIKTIDNLDNRVNDKALEILYTEYNNYVDNMFSELGDFGTTMRNELYEVMDRVMKNYFNTYQTTNSRYGIKKGAINFNKGLKKEKQGTLIRSVSETIRHNIERVLAQQKEYPEVKKYLKDNPGSSINFNIELGSDNNVWFRIFAQEVPVNKLSEGFIQANNLSKNNIVPFIINLLKNNILSFNPQNEILNLTGLSPVNLKGVSLKGNKNLSGYKALQEGALNFINSGAIYNFLNSSYQRDDYWKIFNIENNNQFLFQLLKQLSSEFFSMNLFNGQVKMMEFSNNSIMEDNINSLMLAQDGINKFGINISHYITNKNNNELSLYSKEENISIYDSKISTILGAEDMQKLRFILENEGYFKNIDITVIGDRIVRKHLPELLKIHSYDSKSRDNLFFLIDNIVYPTSYIYDCALAQLESITKDKQLYKLFASVYTTGHNKKEMYDTVDEAYDEWTEANHELRAFKKPSGADMFIKTKGLKINLVSLSLF